MVTDSYEEHIRNNPALKDVIKYEFFDLHSVCAG